MEPHRWYPTDGTRPMEPLCRYLLGTPDGEGAVADDNFLNFGEGALR